jgi:hypothetical protein
MESPSRRNHDFESVLASGDGMVQRPAKPKLETQNRGRGGGRAHPNRLSRRILEAQRLIRNVISIGNVTMYNYVMVMCR